MLTTLSPRSVRSIWLLTLLGTILWLGAIVLAPWLSLRGASGPARVIYAAFAPLCHQIPDRCFTLGGHPLPVCGRCLGIYAGFAAGLSLYPWIRGFSRVALPDVRLFLLLTLPMAVDAVAGLAGLWTSPIWLRAATGLAWGAVLPFYFVTGIADFIRLRRERTAARALVKGASTQ